MSTADTGNHSSMTLFYVTQGQKLVYSIQDDKIQYQRTAKLCIATMRE